MKEPGMNPLAFWVWPWMTTMEMCHRALQSIQDAAADAGEPPVQDAPEWATPNRVVLELDALRLRDFSTAARRRRPALVVAPYALHDAALADMAQGHSLIQTLRANGCARLFLIEWKSATAATRLHTIDSQLAALNVAVDEIGPPVDLIGLCQGGWLSLAYAARFPAKTRRLVLAGAPVDMMAEHSALSAPASPLTEAVVDELIRLGGGLVLGRRMASLWPRELDETSRLVDSLQLDGTPGDAQERRVVEIFERWDRRTLDLPGPYYRQVLDWLFRENRLAAGTFPALGRTIDLSALHCPLFLLAGARDAIAPPAQVFAAARLVGSAKTDVRSLRSDCGHLALFMGRRTLCDEWIEIAQWLCES